MSENDGKRKVTYYQTADKPKEPVVYPGSSLLKQNSTSVKSKEPAVIYHQSAVKPKAPVGYSGTSLLKQYSTAYYHQTAVKPKEPAVNYHQNAVKPKAPAVIYHQSAVKPKVPVVYPGSSSLKQYSTPIRQNLQVKHGKPLSPEPMNVDPESPFHGMANITSKTISPTCICHRNAIGLACPLCGFYQQGLSVQKKCPAHPRVQYIMGLKKCPNCPNSHLIEEEEGEYDL